MNNNRPNSGRKNNKASFHAAIATARQVFILLALLVSIIAPGTMTVRAAENWTAYNDCIYDSGEDSYIGTNVTTFGIGDGFSGDTSGELIDQATGDLTGVTAALTQSGDVNWQSGTQYGGEDTAAGTDANDTFSGIADMTGVIQYGDSGWYVDLTFSGLDPAKYYTFATSASRNNDSYLDRYTMYTLSGVDAAMNASTTGTNEIDNLTVWFNTGDNHDEGYVARWSYIQPGADGSFTVRAEAHPDANDGGRKAYAFDVFMLHEESGEPPEQYTLTATDDGNGSVTLNPAGGLYYEDSVVTLTPIPNSSYLFANWSGPDAGDLTDNGNGTWNIVMDADKEVHAEFLVSAEVSVSFQQGVDGYGGTVDTYILEDEPDTGFGDMESVEWDADDPYGSDQYKYGLIRFEDIFGSDPGQIPPGVAIQSATLSYQVSNTGDPADFNEVAIDWLETDTWNGFGGEAGVQADEYGAYINSASGAATGLQSIDVTASLNSWTNAPTSNRGWIFRPTDADGVDFYSSEYSIVSDRPLLSVTYLTGPVNQPPDQPTLVQPLDGAVDIPTSPVLEVLVTDPEADPMDVTFYGRQVDTGTGEDFTLIALPDTQMYAQSYPAIFNAQTQWIVDNLDVLNIAYVAHEGDIVNTASSITQWDVADAAMSLLEDPVTTGLPDGIPYGVVPGNHDTPTTYYNDYFGVSRFEGRSYYGGHYSTTNDNNYILFTAGGMDFVVVDLEYQPGTAELDWADARLKEYSDRRGIVVSHSMLNVDDSWSYQAIYDALKDNPNLFLMLCGHMHTPSDGAAQRIETGDYGNTIYVLLADYQDYPSGGNGYLRIMEFSPANDTISVETYSPSADASLTDAQNEFSLPYDMDGSGSFELLGTVSGVPDGASASITWAGLDLGVEYEWYAIAADVSNETNSDTWSFITSDSNTAPVAIDDAYSTGEDTTLDVPAGLGVLANDSDLDGDPLTAINPTDPGHGSLTLNSDGSFIYIPDTGYTGSDSFTYEAFDGMEASPPATVSIVVNSGTMPPLPSSFYGEIHIFDNPPTEGGTVEAHVPGMIGPAVTTLISTNMAEDLVYSINVPGDISGTPEKEGGVEGDSITFMIDGRIVAIGEWHGGPNIELNFHPPQADPGDSYSGGEGTLIAFNGAANDWGSDAVLYQWDWDNDGTYDETGQNPSHSWPDDGVFTVGLKVTDAQGGEGTATVEITVTNIAPVLDEIGDRVVDELVLLTFTATATDNDPLSFSLIGEPAGALITTGGVFTWTPTEAQGLGEYPFTVEVCDNGSPSLCDDEEITVTVNEVNQAPVLDPIGDQSVTELDELTFTATATDADLPANNLVFSLVGAPTEASITTGGVFTWTPLEEQGPNDYDFTVQVCDDGSPSLCDEEQITITVEEANQAPVLDAVGDRSVDELSPLTFTATASDADIPANVLAFGLVGAPTGANITTAGVFTWTPTEAQGPGEYLFTVQVCDDGSPSLCDDEEITVTVNEVNQAPVLDPIGDQSVVEMNELTFTATASDADLPANNLAFSLIGEPAGASITTAGVFTWTPTDAQGPGEYDLTVQVCDDGAPSLCDDEEITITVEMSTQVHSISLEAGWNLVSFNVQPEDTAIEAVLASIDGNYDLVYAWDATGGHPDSGNWMKYAPPPAPPYQNSLAELNETMGFWIHMTAADTLDVTGTVPASTAITLTTAVGGWNLVGYPSAVNQSLPEVLSDNGVGEDFTLVYAYHANDTADPWKLFDRTAPGWANELQEMDPGWGYWVYVIENSIWTVE